MYGPPGEGMVDIGAVVAEIGSHAVRMGFAGEDQPRTITSSYVGVIADDSAMQVEEGSTPSKHYYMDIGHPRPNMELQSPLVGGLVDDWDLLEQLWHHTNKTTLGADLTTTPVLVVEKAFNTPALRQRYTEMLFEKFQVPALFMAKDSVLSCFACGKTTGLVVDIGAETTTVTPVQEGWCEPKGVVKSRVGGRLMDRYLLWLLDKAGTQVRPHCSIKRTLVNQDQPVQVEAVDVSRFPASYMEYAKLEVVRDLKELVCRMAESSFTDNDPRFANVPRVPYELPDGTIVQTGIERFRVPEILINPEPAANLLPPNEPLDGEWNREGLAKMVTESLFRCERETQTQLLTSVVLVGGGSCVEGTTDRLKVEVEVALYGQAQVVNRVKVIQPAVPERKVSAWLGGSIVASLGSFHETWIGKAEYAEHGPQVVDKKCP